MRTFRVSITLAEPDYVLLTTLVKRVHYTSKAFVIARALQELAKAELATSPSVANYAPTVTSAATSVKQTADDEVAKAALIARWQRKPVE